MSAAHEHAPETLTILVCPVCGRNDSLIPFTGNSHFHAGARCEGKPERVTYRKVAAGGGDGKDTTNER